MPHRPADNSRLVRNGHIFGSLLTELQQRIRKGEWQPGSHLPSITHLAHSFGVSTGSVREALRSIDDAYLMVYGYDPGRPDEPTTLYCHRGCEPTLNAGYPPLAVLEFGRGYWLYVDRPIILYLKGRE